MNDIEGAYTNLVVFFKVDKINILFNAVDVILFGVHLEVYLKKIAFLRFYYVAEGLVPTVFRYFESIL